MKEYLDIVNKYFPVLDHGFVALKDVMGTDESIEEAARVSYGAGTRKKSETRGLIRYLLRHKHTTPFEMVELKFHCAMPLFVARQWIRHRTANVNEYSGRYSLMPMIFYTPEREQCATQSKSNNQGRDEQYFTEEKYESWVSQTKFLRNNIQTQYEWNNEEGMARELARIDLPLSMYTYWYWKIDLHNLFHFLRLRCDSHAQWEIRAFANVMAGMVQRVAPIAFEAWVDYSFCASNLTRLDKIVLNRYLEHTNYNRDDMELTEKYAQEIGMSKREISEFWDKIKEPAVPDFSLDLASAKDYSYFEQMVADH